MTKTIERIKYWGQLFLLPLYWLSFLFPRNRRIWLFGSTFGRRFADNPRYLYLYVSQMAKKDERIVESKSGKEVENPCYIDGKPIRPIWISHSEEIVTFLNHNGYEAYTYHSLKGIWYALCGKVYFYDNYSKDINFWQSGGAVKFNMWHGVPLKKIQHDNVFDKFRHPVSKWEAWKAIPRTLSDEKPSDYVLATSMFMKPIFASAFRTENVSTVGYPRIDGFAYDEIENLLTDVERQAVSEIEKRLSQYSHGKMIYYMPTFRDSEAKFFDVMNLQSFDQFLKQHELVFCTKLHPKSKLRKQFDEIQSDNIVVIDADTDPYVFIEMSDALVTDYSSIYFDYLFTRKPIVFFDYDLEQYLSDSREMYFDYAEYTPGIKAVNQVELETALKKIISGEDVYQEARDLLQHKMYDETRQPVSGRLVQEVQGLF